MIRGRQIRAARGLLLWEIGFLAAKAGLSPDSMTGIENETSQPRAKTLAAITQALEENGIEFVGDRGVALRDDQVVTIRGENAFVTVLEDVIAAMRRAKKPEALF